MPFNSSPKVKRESSELVHLPKTSLSRASACMSDELSISQVGVMGKVATFFAQALSNSNSNPRSLILKWFSSLINSSSPDDRRFEIRSDSRPDDSEAPYQ
ncbi:hypothetical protein QYF36_005090 [Acer negundo]|nr:hypothetical protein QYF36_005090 [Acer negundo]